MKFLRNLFGKKSAAPEAVAAPAPVAPEPALTARPAPASAVAAAAARAAVPQAPKTPSEDPMATTQILQNLAERLKEPSATGIWDLEDDATEAAPRSGPAAASAPVSAPAQEMAARAPARGGRRNKTRLIGFDGGDTSVVDLFGDEEAPSPALEEAAASAPTAAPSTFPVGWVLVVQGPGRGHAFALGAGMSSIGRGEDQTVPLAFGDAAISRQSHAAIVYDPEERSFILGQGGKSNIVRLNGKPVIANEPIADGDDIKIGETVLKLKTLCGPDFDWADTAGEEDDDDVAIA